MGKLATSSGGAVRGVAVFLVLVLLSGCGARRETYLSQFESQRLSWDSVLVDVSFASRTALGGVRPVEPGSLVVRAYNRAFEELYEGSGPTVTVPDQRLGSSERIILEACGHIEGARICEQQAIQASPKRVHIDPEVTYPRHGRYNLGLLGVDPRLERQSFRGSDWETLGEAPRVAVEVAATVAGEQDTRVTAPVRSETGTFDLADHENYQEFEHQILQALEEERRATVQFEFIADSDEGERPLASLEHVLEPKTREERESELEFFVRQAAEQVLERMEPYRRAQARVREWRYDEAARRYEIAILLRWWRDYGRAFWVEGEVIVGEDGSRPLFELQSLGRNTRQIWSRRIGERQLPLREMDYEPTEEDGPLAAW